MKILIVTQYFYPENFKGNDIAFEMQKRGHQVTVLTGIPNYPQGIFFDGYGYFKNKNEVINGVKIIRTFLIPRGNGKGISLILNYLSWAFFASFYAIYLSVFQKFDKIFVQQLSPVMMGIPAVVVKKIQKIPIYFWVLDLWPESLESAGGIKNKKILNIFEKIVKFLYRNSDKILISSKGFKKSILEKGNFENKIIYFPNWAEDSISNAKISSQESLPVLPEGFKIIFAGNFGVAQDLGNVLKAANILKENTSIKFLFLGDGREKQNLLNFIKEKKLEETVFFLGKFPLEEMPKYFLQADCLLVSLKNEPIFNLTLPAKTQAYMTAKKPIISMMNGEGYRTIEEAKCGFSVEAGDFENLAKKILEMSRLTSAEKLKMGENGLAYYQRNFDFNNCMDNLENILK